MTGEGEDETRRGETGERRSEKGERREERGERAVEGEERREEIGERREEREQWRVESGEMRGVAAHLAHGEAEDAVAAQRGAEGGVLAAGVVDVHGLLVQRAVNQGLAGVGSGV
jgi:hypothetical protein